MSLLSLQRSIGVIEAPTDHRPDAHAWRDRPGILHLAGIVTEEVYGFLGPATAALADMRVAQTIVFFDDPRYAHVTRRFHPSIELICIDGARIATFRRWTRTVQVFRTLISERSFFAVHLHGFVPCLLGGYVVARSDAHCRVVYSPHGSKSLGPLKPIGIVLRKLLARTCALARQRNLASVPSEARALNRVMAKSAQIVENAVNAVFFDVVRDEARRPLVMTAGGPADAKSVDSFAQVAVLLGSKNLGLRFNWCGAIDDRSKATLNAAMVRMVDADTDIRLAMRLASTWIYVETGEGRGFPRFVAAAMAAGVPCIATDAGYHRDVIEHGETGFLYRTDTELLLYIAQLIDDRRLRRAMGRAAREVARRRFWPDRFRASLRQVYGLKPLGNRYAQCD